jgi:hypothetical protein
LTPVGDQSVVRATDEADGLYRRFAQMIFKAGQTTIHSGVNKI